MRCSGTSLLQIVAVCPLAEGEEVFNTFGELTNAELVSKYGFALPENPFTAVTLDKQCVMTMAANWVGKAKFERRRRYIEDFRSGFDDL